MNEIDIRSRLEELGHYQKITKKLCSKFNDAVKRYNLNSPLKSLVSSPKDTDDAICMECLLMLDQQKNKSLLNADGKSLNEPTICQTCSSKSNPDIYSPIWLLSRSEKLQVYENAIKDGGHLTEPEMAIAFNDGIASTTSSDGKKTFAEITKYQRDVKRKRMKHRTTKAPPLTHTEELRSLISLQMELWEDFVVTPKNLKRKHLNK